MAKQKSTGWLDKFNSNVAATDATRVNKQLTPTNKKKVTQEDIDAREVKARRNRITVANAVKPQEFSSPKNFAVSTSAIADKLRFSEQPNFFDDYINPGVQFGHLASGLGQVPLNIQEGNYGQAAMNFTAPVFAGVGEGVSEMLLKPIVDPLMTYGKNAAKSKLSSVLGKKAPVPSMGPYMKPSHVIDDLSGTSIGKNINEQFGIDQFLFDNPQLVNEFRLPLYKPGSGSGLFPTTAKTSKEFKKQVYDKAVTHLYQRNKLMHGCGSAAECAKIANAITSSVNRQITPDDVYDYAGNADNAWYSTSQMLRNNGELLYNEELHGPISSEAIRNIQVGDQVMLGPDAGTSHPNISSATGNIKESNVNHRATVAGVDSDGNIIINESIDGRLISVPLQNNVYYNGNSNFGIRSIVRPGQFVDKAKDIAKRAILNDVNLNTGTMEFGVSPELQPYKEVYDKIKPTLIGNLGIHADDADQIFRHVLGIGVQESKMSGKMAKGLTKAKILIQDKLREAGLTKPVKEIINVAKKYGNRKYKTNPELLDFPGNSKMQMEANKLADKEGITFNNALEQLYNTTYNKPKPFALSDTNPSVGAFRQKHLSKTAERLGLTENDFKIGKGNKNSFYNNPENELTAAFANFYDIKNSLAKKHPDWSQQKLYDMATLSWNSPSKANNSELVDYFYEFADNQKFEGFDYLNKVKNNIKTNTPLKSVTPHNQFQITKPFLQFKQGGWLEKYNDGGPVQENYNDYSVSAPEGFQGDGYSNVGRDYSPAWGGQFEDGGKVITSRKDFSPGILSNVPGLSSLASGNQPGYNRHDRYGPLGDLYRYYGGLPLEHNVLMDSQYKPAKSKDKNAKYISLNRDPEFVNEVLENYKRVSSGKLDKGESRLGDDNWQVSGYSSAGKDAHKTTKQGSEHHSNAIGRYILGKGKDEKGEYISYYDKFDEGTGSGINPGELLGLTKPFEIYDRIYVDPKTGKPKMAMGGSLPGSVGFTYARTNDPAPSNGKYAKKTKASAQNGTEMRYYQEGLDFKPKSISRDGSQLVKLDQLTNFTNYNTKQPGGWLDKYEG
jgi:hypothetical protein